jgi:hypothetical protein
VIRAACCILAATAVRAVGLRVTLGGRSISVRNVRAKRARRRWGPALAAVGLASIATLAWGLVVFVGLVRLQVHVTDAGSRVEAASRSRAELAANVTHAAAAFDCVAPDRLAALRSATERAGGALLGPRILDDPGSYRQFLLAQDDLTSALDEVWPVLRASRRAGPRFLVEDLHANLEQARASLTRRLGDLDRSVDAYHARSTRFPASLIAGMASEEGPVFLRSWLSGPSVAANPPPAANPG